MTKEWSSPGSASTLRAEDQRPTNSAAPQAASVVERVAKAAYDARRAAYIESMGSTFLPKWEELNAQQSARELAAARAAIEAMKEPTEEMLSAANRLNHPRDGEIWAAMIDQALK